MSYDDWKTTEPDPDRFENPESRMDCVLCGQPYDQPHLDDCGHDEMTAPIYDEGVLDWPTTKDEDAA